MNKQEKKNYLVLDSFMKYSGKYYTQTILHLVVDFSFRKVDSAIKWKHIVQTCKHNCANIMSGYKGS